MARDPGSMWSPLAEWNDQGSHIKNAVIIHSTGDRGSALAIYNYFNRPSVVVESTFVIGLSPADPTRQLLDSASTADANVQANQRAISIEVVGQAGDDYTDWQVQEILRICRWAMKVHPIPARICANPNDAGFGWHVMFGAPGPWAAVAKVCPGPVRVERLKRDIFPALFGAPTVQEDDLPYTPAQLDKIVRDALRGSSGADRLEGIANQQRELAEGLGEKLDAIIALLQPKG